MEYKVRCSSIGAIMTNPRTKAEKEAGILSKTAQQECIDMFCKSIGIVESFSNKYTIKGNECENDSISLVNDVYNLFLIKNETTFSNDHLTGTPDAIDNGVVHDVKTKWSLKTFLNTKLYGYDPEYEWQLRGYMALTGCKQAKLHYCLVNATPEQIEDEKRKISYQFKEPNYEQNQRYIDLCKGVERKMIINIKQFMLEYPWYDLYCKDWANHNYNPKVNRVITFTFEHDEKAIEQVYKRVEQANLFIENTLAL